MAAESDLAVDAPRAAEEKTSTQDHDTQRAFFHSVSSRSIPIVRAFLALGVSARLKDRDGLTSLHLAAISGSKEMVKLLLDLPESKRPELEAVDRHGHTAMHKAAIAGARGVIGLLRDAGASTDPVDADGMTPLQHARAAESAFAATEEVLRERSAAKKEPATKKAAPVEAAPVEEAKKKAATTEAAEETAATAKAAPVEAAPVEAATKEAAEEAAAMAEAAPLEAAMKEAAEEAAATEALAGHEEAATGERRKGPRPDQFRQWVMDMLSDEEDDLGLEILSVPDSSADLFASQCPTRARITLPLGELAEYIRDEMPSVPLEKALVVMGDGDDAYVTSAERYARWRWQELGVEILRWVYGQLLDPESNPEPAVQHPGESGRDILLVASGSDVTCKHIQVTGDAEDVTLVFEVLAWMVSAFRKPCVRLVEQRQMALLSLSRVSCKYGGPWVLSAVQEREEAPDDVSGYSDDESGHPDDEFDKWHFFRIKLEDLEPVEAGVEEANTDDTRSALYGSSSTTSSSDGGHSGWSSGDRPDGARCWNSIFGAFVVAWRFPIPSRPPGIRGIEVPLDLMKRLAGLEYPLPFLDTFVLKGKTAAVLPYRDDIDSAGTRCIQWHLEESENDSGSPDNPDPRISMGQVLDRIGSGPVLAMRKSRKKGVASVLDENARGHFLDTVASTKHRHFLGLYPAAEVHVGSNRSQADRVQDPTEDATDALPRKIVWGGSFTTGLSAGIPGGPAISLSTAWALSCSQKVQATVPSNLEILLRQHYSRSAILYDTVRHIGWMVPEACVMLHMMQAYLHRHHQASLQDFPAAGEMTQSVSDFVKRTKAFLEEPKTNTLRADTFKTFATLFQQMRERIHVSRRGAPLSFHSFTSDQSISGAAFVATCELVDPTKTLRMRQVRIGRTQSGGWPRMIKDVRKAPEGYDVLVFFGNFPDQPIRPVLQAPAAAPPASPMHRQLCSTWYPLPPGRRYLVAPLQCIRRLETTATASEIGKRHYWVVSPRDPFVCHTNLCDRVQRLATSRPGTATKLPDNHCENAAIVFGGSFTQGGQCTLLAPGAVTVQTVAPHAGGTKGSEDEEPTLAPPPTDAQRQWSLNFPHGSQRVSVSGGGLRCGIRALRESLRHQMPELIVPTEQEMYELAVSGETARAYMRLLGQEEKAPRDPLEDFDSNFTIDHLGGLLREWGESRGLKLRLGVERPAQEDTVIVDVGAEGARTLWIFHQNSHYEGLERRNP